VPHRKHGLYPLRRREIGRSPVDPDAYPVVAASAQEGVAGIVDSISHTRRRRRISSAQGRAPVDEPIVGAAGHFFHRSPPDGRPVDRSGLPLSLLIELDRPGTSRRRPFRLLHSNRNPWPPRPGRVPAFTQLRGVDLFNRLPLVGTACASRRARQRSPCAADHSSHISTVWSSVPASPTSACLLAAYITFISLPLCGVGGLWGGGGLLL